MEHNVTVGDDNGRLPPRTLMMTSKLMAGCLCAMLSIATLSLNGCAQFEDSFGELRPDNQAATVDTSRSDDSKRSSDRDYSRPFRETTDNVSNERSYSLEGVQLELEPGRVTQ